MSRVPLPGWSKDQVVWVKWQMRSNESEIRIEARELSLLTWGINDHFHLITYKTHIHRLNKMTLALEQSIIVASTPMVYPKWLQSNTELGKKKIYNHLLKQDRSWNIFSLLTNPKLNYHEMICITELEESLYSFLLMLNFHCRPIPRL
jgi:hypothetical protein